MSILLSTQLNISGSNPSVVTGSPGTGGVTQYFPVGNTSPGIPSNFTPVNNGYIAPPGNNAVNGQIIRVKAAGDFTTGSQTPSPTVTVGLYGVTFAGNTPSGTPTISSTAFISGVYFPSFGNSGGIYPWGLRVDLMGDTNSGLVQSTSGYLTMDGTALSFSPAVGLSNINMGVLVPFALVVGITLNTADPTAVANMYQFRLDF